MKDNNYKEMISQRKEQAESQAKEYFYNQKQRKAYYWAEGDMYNEVDSHNEAFIHFTDEEVLRIKSLIVAEANSYLNDSEPFKTMEEALEVLSYGELLEQNEELRDLILERCKEADLYPTGIDFDTKYYFYTFGCVAYDYSKNEVSGPHPVCIRLTDEDYLTLLSLQLQNRKGFTFNDLLDTNPELAIKLNHQVEGSIYGWCYPEHVPFTILFDEVRVDAEAIDGPLPANLTLFFESTDEHEIQVLAEAASHVLKITEYELKTGADSTSQRFLADINAEAVMRILDAKDYADMLNQMKCKFNAPNAFDSIKAWLTSYAVPFSEKVCE